MMQAVARPLLAAAQKIAMSIRQAQALRQFYNSQGSFDNVGFGGNPGTYTVGFANVGGIPHCFSSASCANDGNGWIRRDLAMRDRIRAPPVAFTS
ncbi:hypothetical protein DTO271G3_7245 [Paecilomyces variotii]|nr:hypothetical protein DTO271G3_7245 [Paecilomyces variotii]